VYLCGDLLFFISFSAKNYILCHLYIFGCHLLCTLAKIIDSNDIEKDVHLTLNYAYSHLQSFLQWLVTMIEISP